MAKPVTQVALKELSCLCFEGFERRLRSIPPDKLVDSSRTAIGHEFSRFKSWCGGLGALVIGRMSLDTMARDSKMFHDELLLLLRRLCECLDQSNGLTVGPRKRPDETTPYANVEWGGREYNSGFGDDLTEVQDYDARIRGLVDSLYCLASNIRHVAYQSSIIKASAVDRAETERYAWILAAINKEDRKRKGDKVVSFSTFLRPALSSGSDNRLDSSKSSLGDRGPVSHRDIVVVKEKNKKSGKAQRKSKKKTKKSRKGRKKDRKTRRKRKNKKSKQKKCLDLSGSTATDLRFIQEAPRQFRESTDEDRDHISPNPLVQLLAKSIPTQRKLIAHRRSNAPSVRSSDADGLKRPDTKYSVEEDYRTRYCSRNQISKAMFRLDYAALLRRRHEIEET